MLTCLKSTPRLTPSWRSWPARAKEALLDRLRLEKLRHDPANILKAALGQPDDWQAELLRGSAIRLLLNCSRQSGKSTVAAGLALREALLVPGSLILLLSPTQRQSQELFGEKMMPLYDALGRPVRAEQETVNYLRLANGSRVIGLPGEEKTVRCYSSVRLLVIDEAARVEDTLYRAVRPMLAVSGGRLLALSTPYGRRGWFFDEWHGAADWQRVHVKASQCPRIPQAFLDQERRDLGERWYAQEYEGFFADMQGAVFSGSEIDRAFSQTVPAIEFNA